MGTTYQKLSDEFSEINSIVLKNWIDEQLNGIDGNMLSKDRDLSEKLDAAIDCLESKLKIQANDSYYNYKRSQAEKELMPKINRLEKEKKSFLDGTMNKDIETTLVAQVVDMWKKSRHLSKAGRDKNINRLFLTHLEPIRPSVGAQRMALVNSCRRKVYEVVDLNGRIDSKAKTLLHEKLVGELLSSYDREIDDLKKCLFSAPKHNQRVPIVGSSRNVNLFDHTSLWKRFKKISRLDLPLSDFESQVKKATSLSELFSKKENDRFPIDIFKKFFCQTLDCPRELTLTDATVLSLLKCIVSGELLDVGSIESVNGLPRIQLSKLADFRNSYLERREVLGEQKDLRKLERNIATSIKKIRVQKEIAFSSRSSILGPIDFLFEDLPWEVLPPGEAGVEQLIRRFRRLAKNSFSIKGQSYDESRLIMMRKLWPSQCYVGKSGFKGYVVYEFEKTKRVVLECPFYGNATYIIKDNWHTISKLSKWEARNEHSNQVIIIRHNATWFERLKREL